MGPFFQMPMAFWFLMLFPGATFPKNLPWAATHLHLFVFGLPTEPNSYIPNRSTETNNEITRARLSGRDNRDFGPNWAEGGHAQRTVGVSRDLGEETEPKRA